jgi:hypothetical protein
VDVGGRNERGLRGVTVQQKAPDCNRRLLAVVRPWTGEEPLRRKEMATDALTSAPKGL